MNEFERRLKEALTEVRDAGRIGVDPRRAVAKEELFRRLHRRRLWKVGGGAVLAGAAAIAVLLLFSDPQRGPVTERPELAPAEIPVPARALVEVGDQPTHVAVGGLSYVWSANAGSNDVSRIDPSSNEVVASVGMSSSPGDMAIGKGPVWVALPSEGKVVEVSPSAQAVVGEPIVIADGALDHMDLSVGANALWIVARDEGLVRVDLDTRVAVAIEGVGSPTDVAVKGDRAVVLSSDGVIYQVDSVSGDPVGPDLQVEPSDNGQITLAGEALWYYSPGEETLARLDPVTGELLQEIDPEGTLVDFVIDPQVAWALSRDDGAHYLTPIDRTDGEISGDPIEVQGNPVEAVIADGSLWLSLFEEDALLRFSKYR